MYGKSVESRENERPGIYRTFRVESLLGSGGSGTVYKAWHTRLQKHIVVKEAKNDVAGAIEARRNEVEALKNVKNEYMPLIFDFIEEDERSFTIMEYIEGESFDILLSRGHKFTEPQVLKWYTQIVSALEMIHGLYVYHRDIKPSNIMLRPTGDVCLIDFNAALVSGNDTRVISHSSGYASPEQYAYFQLCEKIYKEHKLEESQNNRMESSANPESFLIKSDIITEFTPSAQADVSCYSDKEVEYNPVRIDWKRSDIYSLGATMYHLLTGKHPPLRADEVIPISKLGDYNEGLVDIIESSMQFDPFKRFASAEELSNALECIKPGFISLVKRVGNHGVKKICV